MIRASRSSHEPVAPIKTSLVRCGLAVEDTAGVLRRLAAGEDLGSIRERISTGELLSKRTVNGRKHILTAIRQRFLDPESGLPGVSTLASALGSSAPDQARAQMLLPYLLGSDRAAFEIVTSLVLPRLSRREADLPSPLALSTLQDLFRHHEVPPWSDYLCRRWVQGLFSVLREVGALGRDSERERLLNYGVRAEAFSFHLWGLYDQGIRGASIARSPLWRLLLLEESQVEDALGSVSQRGWWSVSRVAFEMRITPAFRSAADWIERALG